MQDSHSRQHPLQFEQNRQFIGNKRWPILISPFSSSLKCGDPFSSSSRPAVVPHPGTHLFMSLNSTRMDGGGTADRNMVGVNRQSVPDRISWWCMVILISMYVVVTGHRSAAFRALDKDKDGKIDISAPMQYSILLPPEQNSFMNHQIM